VLGVCVCVNVCVFGFQTNFLEFLPLLCVSPHVTSPAVAEAAAAAAAPGIGLEQEPRCCFCRALCAQCLQAGGAWTQAPPSGVWRRRLGEQRR
jgi:hypothetical protein